jgi:hypothetical protein
MKVTLNQINPYQDKKKQLTNKLKKIRRRRIKNHLRLFKDKV